MDFTKLLIKNISSKINYNVQLKIQKDSNIKNIKF